MLKGTRCRLTEEPPAAVLTESFEVKVDATDSMVTAERVCAALSWQVVKGYAVFEAEASRPDIPDRRRSVRPCR